MFGRSLFLPIAIGMLLCSGLIACDKYKSGYDPNSTGPIVRGVAPVYRTLLRSFSSSNTLNSAPTTFTYTYGARTQTFKNITGEFIMLWRNDTIGYILGPIGTNGDEYTRNSYIYLFNSNNQVEKVVKKFDKSKNVGELSEANQFLANGTDRKFVSIDSLVYTATGQLKEVWSFDQDADQLQLAGASKFEYTDPMSADPFKMQEIGADGTLYADIWLKMTDFVNPIRKRAWFVCFISDDVPAVPYNYQLPRGKKYLSMLPNMLDSYVIDFAQNPDQQNYNSETFVYSYNRDSTQFVGRIKDAGAGSKNLSYEFLRD